MYYSNKIGLNAFFSSVYCYMSCKLNNRSDITQLQKADGTMTQATEELNNFFKATFTLEDPDSHIPSISTQISETLSDINISEEKNSTSYFH